MEKQKEGILYTAESEKIFSQLPGLVLWENTKQQFLGLNDQHVELLGFQSLDQALGKTVFDIPCRACELAPIFSAEEKEVLDGGQAKTFFGIISFTSGIKAMMTAKKPLINSNGEVVGVFIQGFDVTNINILQAANSLIQIDNSQKPHISANQFEYEVAKNQFRNQLTDREMECLFFIMRGKSAKDVGRILNISFRTVERHIENMKNKLHCQNKTELIYKVIESGFANILTSSILNILANI